MIQLTLQYQCSGKPDNDNVTYFNQQNNNNSNITKFIEDGVLKIPCGVETINQQVSKYQNKNDIIKILIPDSVTTIENAAFTNSINLIYFDIPDNVTKIGSTAFKQCTSLQTIYLPDKIAEIGDQAFQYCFKLQNINIPKGLTQLNGGIFYGCSSLTKIIIPGNIQTLDYLNQQNFYYGVFSNSGLKQVIIEDGVKEIGQRTFYGCSQLEQVILPDSITTIDKSAFYGCSNLQSITIPQNIKQIKGSTFDGCTNLKQIQLPQTLESIEEYSFQNCKNLQFIYIPDNVTTIGNYAFYQCTNLKYVHLPQNLKSLQSGSVFSGCKSLQRVQVPQQVTIIELAFQNCASLQCVNILNNTTSIQSETFLNTQYQGITTASSFSSYCSNDFYVECNQDQFYHIQNSTSCMPNEYVNYYTIEDDIYYYQPACQYNQIYQVNKQKPYQCVKECPENTYISYEIYDKECKTECKNYILENQIKYCLTQSQCGQQYQLITQKQYLCVDQCPEGHNIINNSICINFCDDNNEISSNQYYNYCISKSQLIQDNENDNDDQDDQNNKTFIIVIIVLSIVIVICIIIMICCYTFGIKKNGCNKNDSKNKQKANVIIKKNDIQLQNLQPVKYNQNDTVSNQNQENNEQQKVQKQKKKSYKKQYNYVN